METKTAITKEQWQEIEANLAGQYGFVTLLCDGYTLTLQVQRIAALKYGIFFYVDGHFLGKWFGEDCEERRRFFQPIERFLHDAKFRNELLKIYGGKRAPKAQAARINQKRTSYRHYWTSVKALRRHLQKHNADIQLVNVGY